MADKSEQFQSSVSRIRAADDNIEYMSDVNNWVMVNARSHLPIKAKDGRMIIPTTAMTSDFKIPRATVHVTLNHVVESHMYGSWDNAPYIVIAPYRDIVAQNAAPLEVSMFDTYFAPNPDTGLVLPDNTRIILPSDKLNPGELIRIDGNRTYYNNRVDKFSDDQIASLVEKMDAIGRADYERWSRGDFQDWETDQALAIAGPAARKLYDAATDKRAFMRGMFEEDRFAMLTRTVRDMAFFQTMANMGYNVVNDTDLGPVATAVRNAAEQSGVPGNISNKGHSDSVPYKIEEVWMDYDRILNGYFAKPNGLLKHGGDWDLLYKFINDGIKSKSRDGRIMERIRVALVNNRPVDFMAEYKLEYENMAKQIGAVKMPADLEKYNPAIGQTLRKSTAVMSNAFNAWRNNISKMPGYDKFIARLGQLSRDNMARNVLMQNTRE